MVTTDIEQLLHSYWLKSDGMVAIAINDWFQEKGIRHVFYHSPKVRFTIVYNALNKAIIHDEVDERNNFLWKLAEQSEAAIKFLEKETNTDNRYHVLEDVFSRSQIKRMLRTHRAAFVRQLLKKVGMKKFQVVTPKHAFATTVDIMFPGFPGFGYDKVDEWLAKNNYSKDAEDCPYYEQAKVTQQRNSANIKLLNDLLIRLFPGTEDRSDLMTDYFDSKWHISSWR
jgi:hypothetical protein